jgi:hypothetical protein
MTVRIQLRRGTTAFWADENPTLHEGEPGYEINTRKWKVGDGLTPWRELPYMGGLGSSDGEVSDEQLLIHINSSTPHPVYDDGPSLYLLYENAKV